MDFATLSQTELHPSEWVRQIFQGSFLPGSSEFARQPSAQHFSDRFHGNSPKESMSLPRRRNQDWGDAEGQRESSSDDDERKPAALDNIILHKESSSDDEKKPAALETAFLHQYEDPLNSPCILHTYSEDENAFTLPLEKEIEEWDMPAGIGVGDEFMQEALPFHIDEHMDFVPAPLPCSNLESAITVNTAQSQLELDDPMEDISPMTAAAIAYFQPLAATPTSAVATFPAAAAAPLPPFSAAALQCPPLAEASYLPLIDPVARKPPPMQYHQGSDTAPKSKRPPLPPRPKASRRGGRKAAALMGEITSQTILPTKNEMTNAKTPRAKQALRIWYDRLNELNEYRLRKGHTNVPQKWEENAKLGIWVNKQRMEKKFLDEGVKSSMTEDRIQALERIGFEWAKRKGDHSWNSKFQELEFLPSSPLASCPFLEKSSRPMGEHTAIPIQRVEKPEEVPHDSRAVPEAC